MRSVVAVDGAVADVRLFRSRSQGQSPRRETTSRTRWQCRNQSEPRHHPPCGRSRSSSPSTFDCSAVDHLTAVASSPRSLEATRRRTRLLHHLGTLTSLAVVAVVVDAAGWAVVAVAAADGRDKLEIHAAASSVAVHAPLAPLEHDAAAVVAVASVCLPERRTVSPSS